MRNNESSFEQKLKKLTEGANPVPQQWQTFEVEFTSTGSLLKDYVREEYATIMMLCRRNFMMEVPFSEDHFFAYNCWCIQQRIDWVNGKKPSWYPTDRKAFPAFISVICQNIGKVTDPESGIILTPKFGDLCDFTKVAKIGQDEVTQETNRDGEIICHCFDSEDADTISRFLKSLGGYQCADGYLKDKDGVADFMLMQVISGEVLSIKSKSHPVYALMASVVGAKLVAASLNPMMKYADVDTLKILLSEVVSVA